MTTFYINVHLCHFKITILLNCHFCNQHKIRLSAWLFTMLFWKNLFILSQKCIAFCSQKLMMCNEKINCFFEETRQMLIRKMVPGRLWSNIVTFACLKIVKTRIDLFIFHMCFSYFHVIFHSIIENKLITKWSPLYTNIVYAVKMRLKLMDWFHNDVTMCPKT